MRQGRIVIYLILIVVIGAVAGFMYLQKSKTSTGDNQKVTPTPNSVSVVIAAQNIAPGVQINADMLTYFEIPQSMWQAAYFTDVNLVIGQYAKYSVDQSMFITTGMICASAGCVETAGSEWATLIPPGMTAIAIPITRLSAAAYGIRDGDHVDIIVSMLFVELDPIYQSILPNYTAGVLPENGSAILLGSGGGGSSEEVKTLTAQAVSGGYLSAQGRVEQDPNLQSPFYVVPSEAQRARLVSQLIIKNVKVLHIGTFSLEKEVGAAQQIELTPTPGATGVPQVQISEERPDIITLIVLPQDAVTLTYLLYIGAEINLTLRNPTDDGRYDTEAATLEYVLNQYNIPVPVKLPYGMQPRLDQLIQPSLPNDLIVVTPEQ